MIRHWFVTWKLCNSCFYLEIFLHLFQLTPKLSKRVDDQTWNTSVTSWVCWRHRDVWTHPEWWPGGWWWRRRRSWCRRGCGRLRWGLHPETRSHHRCRHLHAPPCTGGRRNTATTTRDVIRGKSEACIHFVENQYEHEISMNSLCAMKNILPGGIM